MASAFYMISNKAVKTIRKLCTHCVLAQVSFYWRRLIIATDPKTLSPPAPALSGLQ